MAHECSDASVLILPWIRHEVLAGTTLLVLSDGTQVLYAEQVASAPWVQLM
jgi:hypothetical protein